MVRSSEHDQTRIAMFPNLDYTGLYHACMQTIDMLHMVQAGQSLMGQALLQTLCSLVPFLEHEYMDTLPYYVSTLMNILPASCHKDIVDMLCYNFLPFSMAPIEKLGQSKGKSEAEISKSYAIISIPAILMTVFLCADNPAYNTQLLETLLKLKKDVQQDLFCVMAHGTVKALCPAAELLFQYWPELNPNPADRKALQEKHVVWTPLTCQNDNCPNSSLSNEAVKMTNDLSLAITSSCEKPPPLLICIECADQVYRGRNRDTLYDILLPMETIPFNCESKSCKSNGAAKMAVATCFSIECANYNVNKPVRYCKPCHVEKHVCDDYDPLLKIKPIKHIVHETIPSPWTMASECQIYFVEAVVRLLREAQPHQDKPMKEGVPGSSADKSRAGTSALPADDSTETMALDERQLLSRYGIWLMTSLCTPTDDTPEEVLGRLLAMLFNWFHCTACLPDDQAGSALERLKGEVIHGWLMKVVKSHFQVFVNCLLPHPVEYAKVGGHWDCWPSQSNQIKEGFKRLLCLVPYDIIVPEVWSYIMPFWMDCFRYEVPEEELAELKILLSKVLDPDLSPLGFTTKQMYEFISIRLDNTTAPVQEQALNWIQLLTMLEIPIPIKLLLSMCESAMPSLGNRSEEPRKVMSKIVANQPKAEPDQNEKRSLVHNKSDASEANFMNGDERSVINCYILILDILFKQIEQQEVSAHKGLMATNESKSVLNLLRDALKVPWPGVHSCDQINLIDVHDESSGIQCYFCELSAIWYQLTLLLVSYFSPVVEIAIRDADAIDEKRPDVPTVAPDAAVESEGEEKCIWKTSHGYFEFKISELTVDLQLLYAFLIQLEKYQDADILYHLLGSLKLMCLNADVLGKSVKNHWGFFVYIQENLLIKNLWTLLQAEFSQISDLAVPLLLHSITLPLGREIFWHLVEQDFRDKNWKSRFAAVERVTTIAHFLDTSAVKNSNSLQSSLANAFCYLVHCLDDIEPAVSQRALLNLETVKTSSLRLLLWCLEIQFDQVIVDRAMILQTVFQLYNCLR